MSTLEINVIFGMQTVVPPIQGSVPTFVSPELTSSHSNEQVEWTFQTLDPQIDSVEIEFQDPKDTFFNSRGGPATNKFVAKLTTGYTSIWGTTPHLKKAGVHPSKYTIRAIDSSGSYVGIYELDPTVITVDP